MSVEDARQLAIKFQGESLEPPTKGLARRSKTLLTGIAMVYQRSPVLSVNPYQARIG
jgi:hypothetical protein